MRLTKPRKANLRAAAQVDPFRLVTRRKWTVRPIGMKPDIGDEAMGQAVAGLPGVRGGSAQGQISRGTWETRQGSSVATQSSRQRESITVSGPCRESERPVVTRNSGNAEGVKGPHWKQAE
jgi:hypothetical protein